MQLSRRAEHAVRWQTAQLALLDVHAVRQMRANHRHGHDLPLRDVLRARDDLDTLLAAHIHLADLQVVRVRMRRDLLDAARDHMVEPLIRADDVFHRHARHREAIRELLRRPVKINIILQPFYRNLHSFLPSLAMFLRAPARNTVPTVQNWRRKRMSLS